MIASSTSTPIATVSPPSVMTFSPRSSPSISSRPTAREIGIAVNVMSVVREFIRNSTSTTSTITTASTSTLLTLTTERSMKCDCRITSRFSSTPSGNDGSI